MCVFVGGFMKITIESAQSAQAKLNKLISQLTPQRIKIASVILAVLLTAGGLIYTMTGVSASQLSGDWGKRADVAAANETNEREATKMHERFAKIIFDGIAITTKSMLSNPSDMTDGNGKKTSADDDDITLKWLAESYQYVISLRTSSANDSIASFAVGAGNNTTGNTTAEGGINNGAEYIKTGDATFNINNSSLGFSKTFEAVTSLCKMIAAFWMIGLAIFSYLQAQQKENASKDLIYKLIIQIAVTGMVIASSEYILEFILILGNHVAAQGVAGITKDINIDGYQNHVFEDGWAEFLTSLVKKDYTSGQGQAYYYNYVHNLKWADKLDATTQTLIPAVTILLIDVVAKFVLIQYILELGIKRALFPLSLADIAQEGLRSRGVMWIKSIFAVFIKIIVCAVIGILAGRIGQIMLTAGSGAGNVDGFAFAINQAIVGFTCLGTMLKAGGYVDKLLGT